MRFKLLLLIFLAGLAFLSFMNGSNEPPIGLQVGNRVPAIESNLLNGQPFNLDSLKGKMVLIDFWASYDAPSRLENARKKIILEEYRNSEFINAQGLVIVSISLDRFKSPLNQSIKRDETDHFFHLCDYEGLKSELALQFDVQEQFPNFLVDGEGRIVARGSQMDEIESTLERLEQMDPSRLAAYRHR